MQEVLQEKDFLRGYEIKNWNFTPRIYKIIAISAVVNLAALIVFAQSNLLTMKGCDSPFVSTVCQVIDTVYVGNALFGTDGDYVVKDYIQTEIGEDDEVTIIDVSNVGPPLAYPAGYFAVANPEQYILDENGNVVPNNGFENLTELAPGIPNNPPLMNTPPTLPPVNNNPTTGAIPDSPFGIVNNPAQAGNSKKGGKKPSVPNDSPTELPKFDGDETADNPTEPKIEEKTATNSDPVAAVEINKKPFLDLNKTVSAKWSITPDPRTNTVDIKPFKVVLTAKLAKKIVKDQDGKEREVVAFDPKQTRWVQIPAEEAGDQEMVNIAKQSIEAVGDSGFFAYLYNIGMENMVITLTQSGDKLLVNIESVQPTEAKAKTLSSGLNGLIATGLFTQKGADELFLLKSVKPPTTRGKTVLINVELGKEAVEEILSRKLSEEAKKELEKQKQNPNNSTAQTSNSNVKTGK
ncbi:MAG: hypothetical protein KIS76_17350 [Pyrinomonadaceae bacterium]|nr:hypothetical protein [Pyrinomonadaceae bacterium]